MLMEELLFEMPQSIEPTEFNLNDPKVNKRHAREFLKDSEREQLEAISGGTLYKIGNKIMLIDEDSELAPRLLYYVQWKDIFHKFVGRRAASQIAVWRDQDEPATAGVAQRIFFDYLLPIYGVMITDTMQTPDGRRFWINRIGDAFKKHLHVYYLNLMQPSGGRDAQRELIEIHDEAEFSKLSREKEFWGRPDLFRARKILICEQPLD